ncbi:MAG: rhamnulose-1-phosphate aldolase [Bacteroidaceae bacterium]|nr:rhamnulose-1-phosphate aldolase [Bacteroidaceae bacterium]
MEIIRKNKEIMTEVNRIAEVAGYLWTKGWAERNGGNISVNITHLADDAIKALPAIAPTRPLGEKVPCLGGHIFYVTGTGKRMRYVAQAPFENGSIIRVSEDGSSFDIIAENPIVPTMEINSHLMMHNYLRSIGRKTTVVLHTHPTDLIGMSHCKPFLNSEHLTRTLWSMIPEARIVVPKGIGIVPLQIPGSMELAYATIEQLAHYDMLLWEKHGVLAVGDDIIDCFDAIDTMSKSAQIYFNARMAGYEPEGMTDEQLDALVPAFNL